MLELEEGVGVNVRSDGVGLNTSLGRELSGVKCLTCSVTKGKDLCICVSISNILSRSVNKYDFLDACAESAGVPESRSVTILISYLNTIAIVTDLYELEVNATDSSGAFSVGLASNAKAIYGKFNVRIGYGRLCRSATGIVVRIFLTALTLTVNEVVLVILRTANGVSNKPCVLALRCTLVVTKSGKNCDSIANSRLSCHRIESNLAVLAVKAIDVEGVASCILNVKVAVLGILYLGDLTGDNVLIFGINIAFACRSDIISTGDVNLSGYGYDPTILHLRSIVVSTKNTENYYVVTYNRSACHSIVSCRTVSGVGTVNGKDITCSILNLKVTVLSIVNVNYITCYKVLAFGISIVILSGTDLDSLKDRDGILGKLNLEGLGFGSLTTCDGKSKNYICACIGNGNNEVTALNNCMLAVGRPNEGYVIGIVLRRGKRDSTVSGDRVSYLNSTELCRYLLCGSLNNLIEVVETVNRERNEVRIVAVKNNDTVYVSGPTEVSCVRSIDGRLIAIRKSGGEVGNVSSDIRFSTVKSELKVIAGTAKLLTCDSNALDHYGKSCVLTKRIAVCEIIGNVNEINSLLISVNDLCYAALDLHHAGVRCCRTGNGNSHTNLNAEISYRVLIHLVGVVTADNVGVSKEEVVSGVACSLRVDSNYDTHNGKVVAFLSRHILFKAVNSEYGYGVLILSGESLTLLVSYGELKSVVEFLI